VNGWLLGPEAFSEFVAGRPGGASNKVLDWAETLTETLYVSEMTWAEVRSKAQGLSPRQRESWLRALDEQVPTTFGARLLPMQRTYLARWSEVRLELGPSGKRISVMEAFDAAVCIVEELGYVTKSAYLTRITGQRTHDPWV
jgi:toxin FitB